MVRRKKVSQRQLDLDESLQMSLAQSKTYKSSLLVKIFNNYYGKICEDMPVRLADNQKAEGMRLILSTIPYNYQIAVVSCNQYSTYHAASKMTNIPETKLRKNLDMGIKYIYYPKNIKIANQYFYNISHICDKIKENPTFLTAETFDNRKYIITALNRSGIMYKEQLMRHLSLGWFYLWTIPGIGDAAKQTILKTIDKWNGK